MPSTNIYFLTKRKYKVLRGRHGDKYHCTDEKCREDQELRLGSQDIKTLQKEGWLEVKSVGNKLLLTRPKHFQEGDLVISKYSSSSGSARWYCLKCADKRNVVTKEEIKEALSQIGLTAQMERISKDFKEIFDKMMRNKKNGRILEQVVNQS